MSLRLTPNMLRASYDFVRTTQPFNRWKLPAGELVRFKVAGDAWKRGWYMRSNNKDHHHIIGISRNCIAHPDSLIMVMAHEMIHLYQGERDTESRNTIHNAEFKRLAKSVCKYHGYDPLLF